MANKKIVTEVVQAVFALPWLVARDEGLFEAEGLEVEFVGGVPRDPSLPPELDPTKVDPFWRHGIFEQQGAEFFNACHWGQIRRSDDSSVGGRIVSIRPAIATLSSLTGNAPADVGRIADRLLAVGNPQIDSLISSMVGSWARQRPDEALRWALVNVGELDGDAFTRIAQGIARTDSGRALDMNDLLAPVHSRAKGAHRTFGDDE